MTPLVRLLVSRLLPAAPLSAAGLLALLAAAVPEPAAPNPSAPVPLAAPSPATASDDDASPGGPAVEADSVSAPADSLPCAFFFTDRSVYRPGDPVRWRLTSLLEHNGRLTWNPLDAVRLRLRGAGGVRDWVAPLDTAFEAEGSFPLPTVAGRYELSAFTPGPEETLLAELALAVRPPGRVDSLVAAATDSARCSPSFALEHLLHVALEVPSAVAPGDSLSVRIFLGLPDGRPRSGRVTVAVTHVDSLSAGPGPERLVHWLDGTVPADGTLDLSLPLPDGGNDYRVRVHARSRDLRFGCVERMVAVAGFEVPELGAVHPGDRLELPVSVRGPIGDENAARLEVVVSGGRLVRSPKELRVSKTRNETEVVEIEVSEENALHIEMELVGKDGATLARLARHALVENLETTRTRIQSGTAAPRAQVPVPVDDPDVLAAGGIEVRLAPTYLLELIDPLEALVRDPEPGAERDIARLAAAAVAARHVGWIGMSREELVATAAEAMARLEAAGIPGSSEESLALAEFATREEIEPLFRDARARWAAILARQAGIPVPERWEVGLESVGSRVAYWVERARSGPLLDLGAMHAALSALGGACPEAELASLLARETRLTEIGRIWLALGLDVCARNAQPVRRAASSDRDDAEEPPHVEDPIRALLDDVMETIPANSRSALYAAPPDTLLGSALLLLLLGERAPNHPLVPTLLHGLLDARGGNGAWRDPREAPWTAAAIADLLQNVETPETTRSAVVWLGLSGSQRFAFQPGEPGYAATTFDAAQLANTRRHDDAGGQLLLTIETQRTALVHYQIRSTERVAPLALPPQSAGVEVSRLYFRSDGTPLRPKSTKKPMFGSRLWEVERRGDEPAELLVELEIRIDRPVDELWVREALPPGARFLGWDRSAAAPESPMGAPTPMRRSWIRGDELHGVTVPLQEGLHVVRYRLALPVAGEFGVRGTRAKELGTGEREGRGPSDRLRVES